MSVVKTTSIVAAGCASVVAALFTSKLGVAGTLVGTAMTSMVITLTSAVLNTQFERASSKISTIPSSVKGRLPTQKVRAPGRSGAEPDSEPPVEDAPNEETPAGGPRGEGGGDTGFLQRLASVPGRLRAMSATTRRRVLVSGALAGVAATAIGLVLITSIETVVDAPVSSWGAPQSQYASTDTGTSSTSLGQALNGTSGANGVQPEPSGVRNLIPGGSGGGGQQYEQPAGNGGGAQPQVPVEPAPEQPIPEEPAQEPVE